MCIQGWMHQTRQPIGSLPHFWGLRLCMEMDVLAFWNLCSSLLLSLPFPVLNLLYIPKSLFFPFTMPLLIKPHKEQILRFWGVRKRRQKTFQRKRFWSFCSNLYSSDHREVVAMWSTAKNIPSGSVINNYGKDLIFEPLFSYIKIDIIILTHCTWTGISHSLTPIPTSLFCYSIWLSSFQDHSLDFSISRL